MILLLRGALLAALRKQPDKMLTDDLLTHRVLEHLRLAPDRLRQFARCKGAKAEGARRALRDVLGYRLYFDLRRGWRFTHPNLEQLGYLSINYASLDECAADQAEWTKCHPLLAAASPAVREKLLRDLLDRMRRGLCIKTIYLDGDHLEQVRNRSFAELKEPWGLGEDERPITAAAMIPRPQPPHGRLATPVLHVSHRSVFGRRVKSKATWEDAASIFSDKVGEETYNEIVDNMLAVLGIYGLVEPLEVEGGFTGYRVPATVMEWRLGEQQDAANPFFLDLYHNVAEMLRWP